MLRLNALNGVPMDKPRAPKPQQLSLELIVPDRYEVLEQKAPHQLNTIVVEVEDGISFIDGIFRDMRSAGRGAFALFRGNSGVGKSTFLHTVGMFRDGVQSYAIQAGVPLRDALQSLKPVSELNVVVLEGREALTDIDLKSIEADLHAINSFLRTQKGAKCLIVWPCNTDDLQEVVVRLARNIGGDALVGTGSPFYRFSGPARHQYRKIAENTVAVLNQGATIAGLGVSEDEWNDLADSSASVGELLSRLRGTLLKKTDAVARLIAKEQCKLWIVVVAGNEPIGEVSALTRGSYAAVDLERTLSATDANIVKDLKQYPEKIGILGTVLDAKVFHLPMRTALDVMRTYADEDLRARMQKASLRLTATKADHAQDRLASFDLCKIMRSQTQGTMSRGRIGSNTEEAFQKLMQIARTSDGLLNRALGEALKAGGYVRDYKTERDLGTGLVVLTDLYCETDAGVVRIEMMWRARTSRAEIANYVLTKLSHYGRAIGFLSR